MTKVHHVTALDKKAWKIAWLLCHPAAGRPLAHLEMGVWRDTFKYMASNWFRTTHMQTLLPHPTQPEHVALHSAEAHKGWM